MCRTGNTILVCFGVLNAWCEAQPATSGYWTRLNYGVAAVQMRKVCIAEGYVTHVFHLGLPLAPTVMTNVTMNTTVRPCGSMCLKMRALPTAIDELQQATRQSLTALIEGIYSIILDLKNAETQRAANARLTEFRRRCTVLLVRNCNRGRLRGIEETRRIT